MHLSKYTIKIKKVNEVLKSSDFNEMWSVARILDKMVKWNNKRMDVEYFERNSDFEKLMNKTERLSELALQLRAKAEILLLKLRNAEGGSEWYNI